MKRFTNVHYWDHHWWNSAKPARLRFLYRDVDYEFVRLLRPQFGTQNNRTLEIGAGSSRILPYLTSKFEQDTTGTDFSYAGCLLLKGNFALTGRSGKVVCEDLFASSLKPESFDLVFSFGLIEHFDDPRTVLCEHLRLLRPGGRLVVAVPNLLGWYGLVMKKFAPPLWARHKVLTQRDLADHLVQFDLDKVRTGYLGSFYIQIGKDANWSRVQRWPAGARHLVPALVRAGNGMLSLLFRFLPFRLQSRLTSPALFAAGIKKSRQTV